MTLKRILTIIAIFASFAFLFEAKAQNKKSPASTAEYQSYLAHIAAANASLRLNETAEAKRWLTAAPVQYRNWEWRYLDARTDNSVAKIATLDSKPDEVHYSPDGKMLIAAMPDNSIRLFDAESLKEVKRLTGHKGAVYAAKFSLDGESVAYCSWYLKNRGVVGLVALWDVATAKEIWRTNFATHPLVDIRFSPDGKRLAVGTWEWRVGVWNLDKKDEAPMVLHFDDVPSYSAVDDIAFSPDGKKIAAATKNGTPRVWDLETGKLLFELRGHQQLVFAIAFTNDGKSIYTGGGDAVLIRWDAEAGKVVYDAVPYMERIRKN